MSYCLLASIYCGAFIYFVLQEISFMTMMFIWGQAADVFFMIICVGCGAFIAYLPKWAFESIDRFGKIEVLLHLRNNNTNNNNANNTDRRFISVNETSDDEKEHEDDMDDAKDDDKENVLGKQNTAEIALTVAADVDA